MGSRAGCANRNKEFLLNRLKDMYGKDFDPIINMAQNCLVLQKIADDHSGTKISIGMVKGTANAIDASSSAKLAIDGWDKVAQYVQPKLKAIELSGDAESPLTLEITYAGVKSTGKRVKKKEDAKE